jgi:hypothetical protein
MGPGDADPRLRTVERVVVKRNNPSWFDLYGHWWVEIDGSESYGWWPEVPRLGIGRALRGVPGVLNGGSRGGPGADPRHGEIADHAFHPVTAGSRGDDEIVIAIRRFAARYGGSWRWSIKQSVNCRSFQTDLLGAAGLVVPDEYAHTAGAGCPFLESPRRWRNQLTRRLIKPKKHRCGRPVLLCASAARRTRGQAPSGRHLGDRDLRRAGHDRPA